jgi:hypothetical protein
MNEKDARIEVAKALEELRARVIERRRSPSQVSPVEADGPAVRTEERDADPLASMWEVTERPFTSDTPVIGSLIVRLRELWNWMSTRWYVRALLEQQNRFNYRILQRVTELETHVLDFDADRESTVLTREMGELRVRLTTLEQRIDREMSALHTRLDRIESLLTASTGGERSTER